MTGIYAIVHLATGCRYVGQSRCVEKRWRSHRRHLRGGSHWNAHLQAAWAKYGESAFEFQLLESSVVDQLTAREQYHLDAGGALYNVTLVANRPIGWIGPRSAATCAKISEALRGRTQTPETRAKLRVANLGRKATDETRAKQSAASKGRPGISPTAETRAKIAAANIGKRASTETRAKMSAASLGRPKSAAHRAAALAAISTPEVRFKRRAAQAAGFARVRATAMEATHQAASCGAQVGV